MVLKIFALAFVLVIAFMQSLYGAFSGVIMLFCSIIAAAVALGFFEPLQALASQYIPHPSYAAPAALILSFVLTLLILRVAADNLIRGNIRVPAYVDWGVGGACGFVSGMVCVGVLMLSINLLPLGGTVMLYSGYVESDAPREQGRRVFRRDKLWLNPDGFTTSLVANLSSGSLSGPRSFSSVYPDFPEWVAWTANQVQSDTYVAPTRDKGDGFEALNVVDYARISGGLQARYRTSEPRQGIPAEYAEQTYGPEPGNKLIGLTLALGEAAADRDQHGTGSHRFRPTTFRLVGRVGDRPVQYRPVVIGGADAAIGGDPRIVDYDTNFAVSEANTRVNVYFEVHEDFQPEFVEYRRFARAPVAVPETPGNALEPIERTSEGTSEQRTQQRASGVSRFVNEVDESVSGDNGDLPIALDATRLRTDADVQLDGRQIVAGRVYGPVEQLRGRGPTSVNELKVPSGYRILHIRYSPRQMESFLGRAVNAAARTVNQYFAVEGDTGRKHILSGYYAIATRDGRQEFELYFTGPPDSIEATAFNGMLDYKHIQRNELTKDDTVLGLYFVVPEGVTITKIENQAGAGIEGLNFEMGG